MDRNHEDHRVFGWEEKKGIEYERQEKRNGKKKRFYCLVQRNEYKLYHPPNDLRTVGINPVSIRDVHRRVKKETQKFCDRKVKQNKKKWTCNF